MLKKILLYILVFLSFNLSAQTVITGTVKDETGKPAEAFISVKAKGDDMISAFADTNDKGEFSVEVELQADSIEISAGGMISGSASKIISNKSQRVELALTDKVIELKNVSVVADKIRESGDTINYNVAAYSDQNDRVIGDVLKKMPGINVSASGGISYNGKNISKLYIENMDLLQDRYGLATNNVNAQDIATVQVLENHQSVKALQGIVFTDEVAINLKLKSSAKGTYSINTLLGGGSALSNDVNIGDRVLGTGEMTGMYFAKTRQNMMFAGGNNSGDNVVEQIKSQYNLSGVRARPLMPMSIVMPSTPDIQQKRYWDNRSQLYSINHLEKIGKDKEAGVNMNFYHEDISRLGESESDIFLSETQRLNMRQTMRGKSKENNLEALLRFNNNSDSLYLSDYITVVGKWNKDVSDIVLSSNVGNHNSRIGQVFDRPEFGISNTLNLVNRHGDQHWRLYSSTAYAQKPYTLDVENDSAHIVQDVMSRCITASLQTGYNYRINKFQLDYDIIGYVDLKGLESDLQSTALSDRNDLWYNTYELSVYQKYTYQTYRWYYTLNLPMRFESRTLDDNFRNEKDTYSHVFVSPSARISYEHRNLAVTAGASYFKNVGDYGSIYKGYLMSDYHTFQRSYMDRQAEQESMSAEVKLMYRNVIHSFFFNAGADISRRNNNMMYGYMYDGILANCYAIERNTSTDRMSMSADMSKGFDFWHSTFKVFANYSHQTSEALIQENLVDVTANMFAMGGGFTITPVKWLNAVYSSGFSIGKNYTSGNGSDRRDVRSATNRFAMNVFANKLLTLTASVEDSYNNLSVQDRHSWFADFKAKYKWGRADLELELNNLFNQTSYVRVSTNELDIYTNSYNLRPRNILLKVRFKLL